MPHRKRIADLDLKIENLRQAIEVLRIHKGSQSQMDRALAELARVKAERLRLMLHQVNLGAGRGLHEAAKSRPNDREASAAQLSNSD
jgi:hypothetical protein